MNIYTVTFTHSLAGAKHRRNGHQWVLADSIQVAIDSVTRNYAFVTVHAARQHNNSDVPVLVADYMLAREEE